MIRSAYKKLPKLLTYLTGFAIALIIISIVGWIIGWLRQL